MRRVVLSLLVVFVGCGGPATVEPDAGGPAPDAGPSDAGGSDAGAHDAGGDAGAPDAGSDAGSTDAGSTDAGSTDAGSIDAGSIDAGSDAGSIVDAGDADAGSADAGLADAGLPDAGFDAGLGPDFPIEGFGAATKGGWQPGFDEVLVTNLNDSGPGSLRDALDNPPGPRLVRFALDGTITLANSIFVPSNVTIDGRGHSIVITGKGLILLGTDDVIITHLTIQDVGPNSEDGLRIGDPTFGPSERVVVDHVTFRATGNHGDSANVDEAMSIIFGSRDITLAWLRFENWEKVLLVGNGDASQMVDAAITVSWHHSYFKSTGRRHPQMRYGVMDQWNCFYDDWHMYDWFYLAPYRESFGAQSQDFARIRVENALFRRTVHSKDALSQANDATRCETNGTLDGVGLVTTADSTAPLVFGNGCSGSTGWVRPYAITLDAADATLRTRLETQSGNVP
ncbi:MAG: hypothetical protein U0228_29840 [Myxococcaceae bacterium]